MAAKPAPVAPLMQELAHPGRIRLMEQASKVRALCSIVCWLSLLVCVFLSSGHIAVPIASVALAIVALIGLYGATPTRYPPEMRNPPFDISAQLVGMFRGGVYVWMILTLIYVTVYMGLDTVEAIADDRCSAANKPFVEHFGGEIDCAHAYEDCEDRCNMQVRDMIIFEAALVAVLVAAGLFFVVAEAQALIDRFNESQEEAEFGPDQAGGADFGSDNEIESERDEDEKELKSGAD